MLGYFLDGSIMLCFMGKSYQATMLQGECYVKKFLNHVS